MTPKYKSAFTVTESGGRQNMYAVEPKTELIEVDYATNAETVNGLSLIHISEPTRRM